jgi:predicted ATPase/DNA-binding XRE family transcriptional regulator
MSSSGLPTTDYSFGNWVKRRRKTLDFTQQELARRIGCSVAMILKIEADERRPSPQIAELLAQHLEIPPDQLDLFLKVARQKKAVDRLGTIPPLPAVAPSSVFEPLRLNLPHPLTPLLGRDYELRIIFQQLQDPGCRLLTLTGPGGVGKTRLALEVAHRSRDAFDNSVCFIPLVGTSASEFMIPAIANALGFAFSGAKELKAQLLDFLREKHILLVLDNLEHLLPGIELLVELLEFAPDVKLLITSREPLNLSAEWVLRVQGLPVASNIQLINMESNSAAMLFVQRAKQANAEFTPASEDLPAITRICQIVEGLPLGLELAATWVRTLSCIEIAQEIEHNIDFLSAAGRAVPQRHRSMRAVFDYSWNLLSDKEQQVLMKVSVFKGGFTRAAAEQVAGATLLLLSSLVDKSLLQRSKHNRYDVHDLIRQYAHARLIESGKLQETCNLHFEFFLASAEESRSKLRGAEQLTFLNRLEEDYDNLRAALEWSLRNNTSASEIPRVDDSMAQKSLRLVYALNPFWVMRAQWSEGRNWLQRALEQASKFPKRVEFLKVLDTAALLAVEQADNQSARQLAEENLSLSEQLGDSYYRAKALSTLSTVSWKQKDFAAARYQCELALAQFRELGTKIDIAESLHLLSQIALIQDDLEVAQSHIEEALQIFLEVGDQIMANATSADLGTLAYLRKDFATARSYLERSEKQFREARAIVPAARILNKLGDVARCEHDYEEAKKCYTESLIVCREAGDQDILPDILHNLGYVAKHYGHSSKALALFEEGLRIYQDSGDLAGIAECLVGIAGLFLAQRQVEKAACLLGAAEVLRESAGARLWTANQIEYDRILAYLRESMEENALESAWAKGRNLSVEQAVAEALE